MDKELKNKWVAALRSGEYTQSKYSLRRLNNTYCCLGVLCNLVPGLTWEIKNQLDDSYTPHFYTPIYKNDSCAPGFLNESILGRVGLNGDEMWYLADLNDDGRSFEEIANYIEENL